MTESPCRHVLRLATYDVRRCRHVPSMPRLSATASVKGIVVSRGLPGKALQACILLRRTMPTPLHWQAHVTRQLALHAHKKPRTPPRVAPLLLSTVARCYRKSTHGPNQGTHTEYKRQRFRSRLFGPAQHGPDMDNRLARGPRRMAASTFQTLVFKLATD